MPTLLRFDAPGYLALLALLPLLVAFSFRSLAGLGPVRRWVALTARGLVLTLLILALAGAESIRRTTDLAVIFLVDRSNSIPRAQQNETFEFVRSASSAMDAMRDRMGVIAFDGRSGLEQLPMAGLGITRISDPLTPDETNLESSLRMAMALFPADTMRRVVVLSDGNENVGQALEEAELYGAADVPIDVVPLRYSHDSEVVFERLTSPPSANLDETVKLQMVLRSQRPVRGELQIFQNDQLVDLNPGPAAGLPVELEAGANRREVSIPLRTGGAHRFRAVFQPQDGAADTILANNEGRAFTIVSGQGKVLILTSGGTTDKRDDEAGAQLLAQALARERVDATVEIAGAEPIDVVRLLAYSAVILNNTPANLFVEAERQALASYVRELGGGLIMIGGDESFGAGGWMDTPVEEVMPVSFDIKSKKQIPKGALALVMHACEIPEGNFIGERVAIAAVKTLSTRDLVGVLSYRWNAGATEYWDVPLQEVRDKARIISMIKQMQMGDMPDLHPQMRAAVDALMERRDAGARHMIVISDFDPAPPRNDVIDDMKRHGITCSTVGIGFGGHNVDMGKARWIADSTGGRAYATNDFSQLPQIFIKESRIVQRSLINENPFTPRLADGLSTLVEGLGGEALPALGGYVLSTPKPLAQIPLVRPTDEGSDPILAHWQVGLGKSVAFTSGMWTRWGSDWSEWPKFSKLWAQIVRWASREASPVQFDVSTSVQGGVGKLRVDALDKNAASVNFLTMEGALVNPSAEATQLRLQQTGPGRYEAEFEARSPGSYVVNLAYRVGAGADAVQGSLQTGLSVAFSPEYRELRGNESFLSQLAERTSGRVLDAATPSGVFDRSSVQPAEVRRPIWEELIRWMLVLFLVDVAVRRIAIHPVEVARRIRRYIGELASPRGDAPQSEAVLTTLRDAQSRARQESRPAGSAPAGPERSRRWEGPAADARATERLNEVLGGASELNAPVVARPTKKKPPTSEADFTSRLLKAKQRARDTLSDQDKQEPTG